MTGTSDSERLEAIFREHYEAVLAYARRRAPAALADDVAAETFAIAWRRADAVPTDPLPWLLGVARRVLSTQRRGDARRGRLRSRILATYAPVDLPGDERDPVVEALNGLSERDREAVLLVAWEGLAPREAAVVLGVSTTAFSVRLHRARRRLRAALANGDLALSKGEAR